MSVCLQVLATREGMRGRGAAWRGVREGGAGEGRGGREEACWGLQQGRWRCMGCTWAGTWAREEDPSGPSAAGGEHACAAG